MQHRITILIEKYFPMQYQHVELYKEMPQQLAIEFHTAHSSPIATISLCSLQTFSLLWHNWQCNLRCKYLIGTCTHKMCMWTVYTPLCQLHTCTYKLDRQCNMIAHAHTHTLRLLVLCNLCSTRFTRMVSMFVNISHPTPTYTPKHTSTHACMCTHLHARTCIHVHMYVHTHIQTPN